MGYLGGKRNSLRSFGTVTIKNAPVRRNVEVNRDILARLMYLSCTESKVIDFKAALEYPLSDLPLSLCNADGTMRKTSKSKLANLILSTSNDQNHEAEKESTAYVVDLMALVRLMKEIPETFEELALKILSFIPKGFLRVDIVADCYFENSIKGAERKKRGSSSNIIIKSSKSKVPREFTKFLSCGANKTRMIQLFFEIWTERKLYCLNLLRAPQMILSREEQCISLTLGDSWDYPNLLSNHEEADTKVIAHTSQALQVRKEDIKFILPLIFK